MDRGSARRARAREASSVVQLHVTRRGGAEAEPDARLRQGMGELGAPEPEPYECIVDVPADPGLRVDFRRLVERPHGAANVASFGEPWWKSVASRHRRRNPTLGSSESYRRVA